jgi:hypothetical protein
MARGVGKGGNLGRIRGRWGLVMHPPHRLGK